ncbi:similar to ring finger protein 128 isoform 2 [Rattus norvegicus]|uniref:Similar to ring finger protein 128 isoform 2 n=1 Tax=Rattus norvegicus TaxID=10116 RepID=A6KNX6_RAT|nr:similar to ring finger protein 128 isoform 2 [Rattus norvegicus]
MNRKTKYSFLQLLVIFTFLLRSTASFSMNAYVTVTYFNESSNDTKTETCECGVYGLASPVDNAMGVVGIPRNGNHQACDYNTEFTNTDKPWIALIERGNCTFSEKIQIASRSNADAVVIYNSPETGNQTIQMANFGLNPPCLPWDPAT